MTHHVHTHSPPIPHDEEERLAALYAYHVLDTEPEEAFDRITRLCCQLLGVPIAYVALVDRHRQWFKSTCGLELHETPREISFCAHVVGSAEPLVISDASADPRFADSPLVTQTPHLRFYAGAPLLTPAGHCLGTLCIADRAPRIPTSGTLDTLQQLAAIVVDELEQHRIRLLLRQERERSQRATLELARLNAELKQAKEEAARANRAKSEFLAGISHELRTPLNAVLGFAQVLEQEVAAGASTTQVQYVEQILKGGRNLLELIDELLGLARIESGRIELTEQRFSIVPLLEEGAELVRGLAAAHGVTVTLESDESAAVQLTVCADRSRILQAVLNLITNAVKYNRRGGWVQLEARSIGGVWVRVSVSDSGIGIPVPRQRELFHPFSRLGRETSGIEGTGIGLVAARRLVEQMGGQISFSSEEGVGSVFWIDIPQAEQDPSQN
ncbi:hypothetical protein CKO15_00295 [Halorhodospira abdelmalekii]|uniref:GAF domain-containing sensor histidine kinase n=1 Tax=Halorhodospira abdelmalekii TaxID=421629 RepID=UPI0019070B4F|nr:GAF domain-containing hybrid sensor histidine kinase/response regulator [Halorhodospira abdelmalekii]MBK1733746.1 hypothetical protein [Halorhodospira abdelmalekii]